MNVAFLTREYPPDTAWGGIATMYHTLTHALSRQGHEVHVICQAVDAPGDFMDEGVFVHRVGTRPARYSARARVNYSLSAWLKLRKIIEKYNIEIVEASYWGAEALLYCFARRTPLVVRVDVSAADVLRTKNYSGMRELLSLKVLSFLEDLTLKRADRIIAISKDLHIRVIDEMHIDPGKVDIIHHAVDTMRYRQVESGARARLGINPGDRLVLFVGRLEARKGVHILCQAIPKILDSIPSAKFLLVGQDTNTASGHGSVKSFLVEEAKSRGFADSLIFLDFKPPEELVLLYSACDIFALPSLREGFGLVMIEAMACGKPVVLTSTGLAPELDLDGTNGIMISPGSVEELARAVIKLLSLSTEDRVAAAKRNREIIEAEYSVDKWVDRVIEVYESALKAGVRYGSGRN